MHKQLTKDDLIEHLQTEDGSKIFTSIDPSYKADIKNQLTQFFSIYGTVGTFIENALYDNHPDSVSISCPIFIHSSHNSNYIVIDIIVKGSESYVDFHKYNFQKSGAPSYVSEFPPYVSISIANCTNVLPSNWILLDSYRISNYSTHKQNGTIKSIAIPEFVTDILSTILNKLCTEWNL